MNNHNAVNVEMKTSSLLFHNTIMWKLKKNTKIKKTHFNFLNTGGLNIVFRVIWCTNNFYCECK